MSDREMSTTGRPLLLSGYAAKRCARRVHNEWDATIEAELLPVPPELQARFDAGRAFEASIMEELTATLGSRCVTIDPTARRQHAIDQTLAAMDAGIEVILGGWLPDDRRGHRTGRPDVLLRHGDGYLAGDIKSHLMTKPAKRGSWKYSTLDDPTSIHQESTRSTRIADRYDDFIQLAHYARMLQACGRAADPTRGFIIGTDDTGEADAAGEPRHVITWLDLDAPLFTTFSRSRGSKDRSALERYDHEHDFRVQVAERARQRTGAPTDPEPLVVPIITDECDLCPWQAYCRELLGPDDPSGILEAGRLDVREWRALADLGVLTAQDLAELDMDDDDWWQQYLPEVTHQSDPAKRLRLAVTRARMALAGHRLQRTTKGPIAVPRADVEIDFDIEWGADNRVFLWGALLTDHTNVEHEASTYVPFIDLTPMDEQQERHLAQQFLDWLRLQQRAAREQGRSIRVYHYSHPEITHLKRVLGIDEVADVLPLFTDLLKVIRANFIGVAGLGIKQVAPEFGFHWRDDDPGGLQAQIWLEQARATTDEQERQRLTQRLLDYNEDDVRATAAVRAGLASAHPAR